ncbi:MAG: DUF2461 family protein [Candidatus Acidiferrales bacterium]
MKATDRLKAGITKETFKFFKDLAKHNSKDWMDANRERYQQHVVEAMRGLLEALTPGALKLNGVFVITGKSGTNFSRINRDIRFAKDKTPYHTRMYLKLPNSADGEGSELYVGINPDTVTAGFRIYAISDFKKSPLAQYGVQRAIAHPAWVAKQKKRLGRKYESYWHAMEKGEWTKHEGWPASPDEWKIVRAWIVRRKMNPAVATKPAFIVEVTRVFRDLAPLCAFASSPKWKP